MIIIKNGIVLLLLPFSVLPSTNLCTPLTSSSVRNNQILYNNNY